MKTTYHLETAALTLTVFVGIFAFVVGNFVALGGAPAAAILAQSSPDPSQQVQVNPPPVVQTQTSSTPTPTPAPPPLPVISDITVSNITYNSGTVSWVTDLSTTGQLEYGTNASNFVKTPLDATLIKNHSQTIQNLQPNLTYQYKIWAVDEGGNTQTTDAMSFKTLDLVPSPTPTNQISVPETRSPPPSDSLYFPYSFYTIPSLAPNYTPSPTPIYTPYTIYTPQQTSSPVQYFYQDTTPRSSSSSYIPSYQPSQYVPPSTSGSVAPPARTRDVIIIPTGKPLPEPSRSPVPESDYSPFIFHEKKTFWQVIADIFKNLW